MFIDGHWEMGSSNETFEIADPSTEETIAEVPRANETDVERAIHAAHEALHGPWGEMRPGYKQSGIGREKGLETLANYLQTKAIVIPH